MITGFNLGQMHHFAQIEWLNNGYIPDSLIEKIKRNIPEEDLQICRVSGTVSNEWAMDLAGYNHPQHDQQINNRKDLLQPTISYFFPFLDFYKKMGFKKLVWTLNTISAWSNPSDRKIWEQRLFLMLDYLDKEGIEVDTFCLENEMWMYPQCVTLGNGSLNIWHKIALAGWKGIFMNDKQFEPIVKKGMREFHHYLEGIAEQIRKRYPSAKIAISIDDDSHLRGQWLSEVTKEFSFYDAVCPHIYISPSSLSELNALVDKRLRHAKLFKKEIYVTEWNWKYDNDSKDNQGAYHDNYFSKDMLAIFRKNGVAKAFKHCLFAGKSPYGEIQA